MVAGAHWGPRGPHEVMEAAWVTGLEFLCCVSGLTWKQMSEFPGSLSYLGPRGPACCGKALPPHLCVKVR